MEKPWSHSTYMPVNLCVILCLIELAMFESVISSPNASLEYATNASSISLSMFAVFTTGAIVILYPSDNNKLCNTVTSLSQVQATTWRD